MLRVGQCVGMGAHQHMGASLSVVFFLEWVVQGFLLLEYSDMHVMNSTILWWLKLYSMSQQET